MDAVFINNAGLVILAPYLGTLFSRCELMEGSEFNSLIDQYKAVQLLHYAATGSSNAQEHEVLLAKIMCGLQPSEPVTLDHQLTPFDTETVDGLLTAVTQQWTALNNTTIDGLRGSFLQRDGKLEEDENAFFMQVAQKAYDMLLDHLPWSISKIKLSWMEKMINVTWR